jgi:hypothetical protein
MATEKTPNYSDAQVALITNAIRENDGIANMTLAETLAADARMNDENGPRKARSIVAKMRRIVDSVEGFNYERKVTLTKDGKPVTKKTELVATIVKRSGIAAEKLDGLDKAPKLALEMIAEAFAA